MQCGPVPPERNTMNEEYPFEGMPETVFELKTQLHHQIVKNQILEKEVKDANATSMALQLKLNDNRINGYFYEMIQKAVQEEPALQPIWDEFVMHLKMVVPDLEEKMEKVKQGFDPKFL